MVINLPSLAVGFFLIEDLVTMEGGAFGEEGILSSCSSCFDQRRAR